MGRGGRGAGVTPPEPPGWRLSGRFFQERWKDDVARRYADFHNPQVPIPPVNSGGVRLIYSTGCKLTDFDISVISRHVLASS